MNVLATLLLALCAGDEKKSIDVVCPVDGHKFQALEVTATNPWGGRDADFCRHAYKTTPLEYYVWVCPACGYSGVKKDFDLKLADEEKRILRDGLKPALPIKKSARQPEIPGHVKYDLMAQAARLRGLTAADAGKAWLHASWSCRQQGAINLEFDEWETLRTNYGFNRLPLDMPKEKDGKTTRDRTEYELQLVQKLEKDIQDKKVFGVNRILARYLAAYTWRKHGEHAETTRWLAELDAMKGENSVVDDAVSRMRASIDLEKGYQKKALEQYAAEVGRAAADKRTLGEMAYLAGELQRRLGDSKEAASWYDKALELSDAEPLRKLAIDQKARLTRP